MNQINDKFKQKHDRGIAVPNERQWFVLEEELVELLWFAVCKIDGDPTSHDLRHRAVIMASTLGSVDGAKLMAIYDAHAFTLNRFRAKAFKIADKQESERYRVDAFAQAMGTTHRMWHYSPSSDPKLREASRQGKKAYAWVQAIRESMKVEEVIPEDLSKAYSAGHEFRNRRTKLAKSVKAHESLFSGAYRKVRDNVKKFDGLFAKRLRLLWELYGWRREYEDRAAVLTKPLEDYAHHYDRRAWNDYKEYKHKGAQHAWLALMEVQRREEELELSAELLADKSWDIEQLIADTRGELTNYSTALDIARQDELRRKGKSSVQLLRKSEAREKQEKLVKKPLKVSTVKRGNGTWINQLELRRAITGRSGWLSLGNERVVHITRFRQWLDVVLKSTETKRRVRKLSQHDWIQIDLDAVVKSERGHSDKMAVRLWTSGGVRVTAHFYNQLEDVEHERRVSRLEPIVHEVQYKEVKDKVRRTVWKPEDIAKYRPVLVPA